MKTIQDVLDNEDALEIGRKAVEDALLELRDARISMIGRGNGLVICEANGGGSAVIRLGTEDALRIALKAILESSDVP